ncbi:Plant cysteine oxidase [Quillaja saponaria]|uniref:cysteine dioxygenase n=1 Tax=Quillaja saponaria TaxID=32244 RepID=A0AAD7QCI0_QUISA|nr:Plant cysteine oxidase [Quillaja saponaria]
MSSKFQQISDKLRIFIQQSKAIFVPFRKHSGMKQNSSKIQALYDHCKNTFTPSRATPPSSQAIQKLCSLLDTVRPVDVGLVEETADDDRGHGFFGTSQINRVTRWAQPITYVDIYECDSFTICMFCFPTSSAYDWVEPACSTESMGPGHPPVRLAKLAVDKVLTAPVETSVLYPNRGGNLHCFTAITPCAVLDVLSPPYREDAGRKCTYYHDYPYSTFSAGSKAEICDGKEEDYAWLAEIGTPDDLYMRPGVYAGPDIQI